MRRGVITGPGAVPPLGIGVGPTWEAILAGRSGVGRITKFDPSDFSTTIAAEVKGFVPEDFIDRKEIKRMAPFIHLARAPTNTTTPAGAAASHAIGEALLAIRRGVCDAVIAGGSEATITPMGLGGFCAMKALSTRNGDPARASRPFDRDRDGFVMGEGAAMLILEELGFAKKRGANIYAELCGYGASGDAHHVTAPAPGGEGAVRCMRAALSDARVSPGGVDYINHHGTATPYNDVFETMAIKAVFGDHAQDLMVSSTKSMTGHLLGAAGATEGAFSLLGVPHRG